MTEPDNTPVFDPATDADAPTEEPTPADAPGDAPVEEPAPASSTEAEEPTPAEPVQEPTPAEPVQETPAVDPDAPDLNAEPVSGVPSSSAAVSDIQPDYPAELENPKAEPKNADVTHEASAEQVEAQE